MKAMLAGTALLLCGVAAGAIEITFTRVFGETGFDHPGSAVQISFADIHTPGVSRIETGENTFISASTSAENPERSSFGFYMHGPEIVGHISFDNALGIITDSWVRQYLSYAPGDYVEDPFLERRIITGYDSFNGTGTVSFRPAEEAPVLPDASPVTPLLLLGLASVAVCRRKQDGASPIAG